MSWSRRAALVVALFVGLFLVRVMLYDVVVMTPEACHTGGIAAEILDHGLRFPLRAYTPERYENGIVIAGVLSAGVMRVLGRSALALELMAHAFGVVTALMGLSLLERVMDRIPVRGARARASARVVFVALTALAPPLFTYKMLDPLGDHNEGTALNLVLLVLLVRRMEQPASRARFAALWLSAGPAVFWEKGALMAAALGGVYELLAVRHGASSWRRLFAAPLLFLMTYAPGLFVHWSNGFSDIAVVAGKFGAGMAKLPMRLALFGLLSGAPLLLLVGFATSIGAWVRLGFRDRRWDSPTPYLAGYVVLHLALASASNNTIGTYFVYGFPLWTLGLAVIVATLGERLAARFPAHAVAAHAAVVLSAIGAAAPALRPDPGRLSALSRDEDHATCYWRFGRAFWLFEGDSAGAFARCRALGDTRALECISGIPFIAPRRDPTLPSSRDEALAFAFGVGRAGVSAKRDGCAEIDDGEERAACERGRRWECFAYADIQDRLLRQRALGRPSCGVEAPFLAPYFARSAKDWMTRPPAPYDPKRLGNPDCEAIFSACVDER